MQRIVRYPGLLQEADGVCRDEGVWGAGLATTVLPAISAAATWPVKIASGKFHGEMAAKTPRPRKVRLFVSPAGPGKLRGSANNLRPSAA